MRRTLAILVLLMVAPAVAPTPVRADSLPLCERSLHLVLEDVWLEDATPDELDAERARWAIGITIDFEGGGARSVASLLADGDTLLTGADGYDHPCHDRFEGSEVPWGDTDARDTAARVRPAAPLALAALAGCATPEDDRCEEQPIEDDVRWQVRSSTDPSVVDACLRLEDVERLVLRDLSDGRHVQVTWVADPG